MRNMKKYLVLTTRDYENGEDEIAFLERLSSEYELICVVPAGFRNVYYFKLSTTSLHHEKNT